MRTLHLSLSLPHAFSEASEIQASANKSSSEAQSERGHGEVMGTSALNQWEVGAVIKDLTLLAFGGTVLAGDSVCFSEVLA